MSFALITGASSGIGRATAERLASQGINLILLARRADRLGQLRHEILQSHKVQVELAVVDVRVPQQITGFVEQHSQWLAQVDVLINNAGLAKGTAKLCEGELADWDAMIDTNLKGLLYMTRAVLPWMLKARRGHVVNLGSVAGRWVYGGGAVYCATKFAVRALSESLRMELLGTPIRVSNIEPGMVETEFSEVRLGDRARAANVYRDMQPLTAADIAETIVWCVQRPAHVNIQELVIFPTDQAAIQMVHRRDSTKPL